MAFCIYLMEKDPFLGQLLVNCLERESWQVKLLGKDAATLKTHIAARPHLWIVDADVPDSFSLLQAIREDSDQPRIILTSEQEKVIDQVTGFEVTCDDFLVRPFSPRELVLRIRRVLTDHKQAAQADAVRLQDYVLDLRRRLVAKDQQYFDLTTKEFDLLTMMAHNKGMALSREQILRAVWGEDYFGSDRVVDDLVRRMRKKLTNLKVDTLYGYGYRIIS